MTIRYFVTDDLEWFVTGYPHDYCNVSNTEFPILFTPEQKEEALRVADLVNEQTDSTRWGVAKVAFPPYCKEEEKE